VSTVQRAHVAVSASSLHAAASAQWIQCSPVGPWVGRCRSASAHSALQVMGWLARQYVKKSVKAVLLILWLALLGATIYGSSKMKVDADVNDFIPEGSYLKESFAALQKYFATTGNVCRVYWVSKNGVCLQPPGQQQMHTAATASPAAPHNPVYARKAWLAQLLHQHLVSHKPAHMSCTSPGGLAADSRLQRPGGSAADG
jgi:hypothetical protein